MAAVVAATQEPTGVLGGDALKTKTNNKVTFSDSDKKTPADKKPSAEATEVSTEQLEGLFEMFAGTAPEITCIQAAIESSKHGCETEPAADAANILCMVGQEWAHSEGLYLKLQCEKHQVTNHKLLYEITGGMIGREHARALDDHVKSGHVLPLPEGCKCEGCIKGSMRDKIAFKQTRAPDSKLETMSVDTLHIGGPDCAGNQWNLTMLMNNSALGMCQGTARQDSATAAKVIAKTINYIEAKTDPGNKTGYKIECCHKDPGSQFKGAVTEMLAEKKIVNSTGETDRHTDNAKVENRNQRLQNIASAMQVTAMGENVDMYSEAVGCETVKWANHCINHSEITPLQKEEKKTAYQDQFRCNDTLDTAYGIEIQPWGALCYVYVLKKNRESRLSPKAVRCIWNGVNLDNKHSISAIPISREEGKWVLHKPIHSHRVVTLPTVFPLAMEVNQELPQPPGVELSEPTDNTDDDEQDSDDECDEEGYEVEKVVEHNNLGDGGMEYRMRFKGYTAKDDYWIHESNCKECQEVVNSYWMGKALAIAGGVGPETSESLFLPVGLRNSRIEPVCSLSGHTPGEEKFRNKVSTEANQTLSDPTGPSDQTKFAPDLAMYAPNPDTELKELPLQLGTNKRMAGGCSEEKLMGTTPKDTNQVAVMSVHEVDQRSHLWLEKTEDNTVQGGMTATELMQEWRQMEPKQCEVMMITEDSSGSKQMYHKHAAMFLGAEMAQEVGGVEMALKDVMLPENKEDFRVATDKEIAQMTKRRFVRPGDEAAKLRGPVEQKA